MKKSSPLTLVSDGKPAANHNQPPRKLGAHGLDLWRRVTSEYPIEDAAGVEVLTLACEAADRAASLSAAIEENGELIQTRAGVWKENPMLRSELAARGFVAKMLIKLGLHVSTTPPRGPGRPPRGGLGWDGDHA